MSENTILSKEHITQNLEVVKSIMENEGRLEPVVFIKLSNGNKIVTSLDTISKTSDSDLKMFYLKLLKKAIVNKHNAEIEEAVMLLETWFVTAKDNNYLSSMPSQHPERKEAIVICGRNKDKSKISFVLQPFEKRGKKIKWLDKALESYQANKSTSMGFEGLVDYLFD